MRNPWRAVLILFWALLFLGRLGETQLKQDGMTYAAVAKHMATSGDWRTPRYTPSAYPEFYQHPPLGFWMEGAVFKWVGISTPIARLVPAAFALGTLLVVEAWAGPVAGLVLLTTPGYLKYASDFLLDGLLAFWLVAGSYAFLRNRWSYFGIALGAALMTKGLVALSLPAATLPFIRGRIKIWIGGLVTAALLIGAWLLFGNGVEYLRHYFAESVNGRLTGENFGKHFAPLVGLAEVYWPWLPFFICGAIKADRLALLHAVVILAGFCLTGHYYQHYLVPFYPFAAIVASACLPVPSEVWAYRALKLGLVLAVAGAVLPIRLRAMRDDPIREAAPWARDHVSGVREAYVSTGIAEKWMGLAATLWETNWEATSVTLPIPAKEGVVLLTAPGETPGPGWIPVDSPAGKPYRVYRR